MFAPQKTQFQWRGQYGIEELTTRLKWKVSWETHINHIGVKIISDVGISTPIPHLLLIHSASVTDSNHKCTTRIYHCQPPCIHHPRIREETHTPIKHQQIDMTLEYHHILSCCRGLHTNQYQAIRRLRRVRFTKTHTPVEALSSCHFCHATSLPLQNSQSHVASHIQESNQVNMEKVSRLLALNERKVCYKTWHIFYHIIKTIVIKSNDNIMTWKSYPHLWVFLRRILVGSPHEVS